MAAPALSRCSLVVALDLGSNFPPTRPPRSACSRGPPDLSRGRSVLAGKGQRAKVPLRALHPLAAVEGLTRRQALLPALVAMALPEEASPPETGVSAEGSSSPAPSGRLPPPQKVFVAGASGRTGEKIVRSLIGRGIKVQAGVRDVQKAKNLFADVAPDQIQFVVFDVLEETSKLAAAIDPAVNAIIVATGFSPPKEGLPNLFMPWQVDSDGTKRIMDAARSLGIPRLVLVSSLLTNGAAWGQVLNPNYLLLNLFGLILIAKLQAERYIQRSGINYTIVRPGGLRNDPPRGTILASSQDTLAGGSISRESVAEVSVEALLWNEASFKIVEIIEEESAPAKTFEELFAEVQ